MLQNVNFPTMSCWLQSPLTFFFKPGGIIYLTSWGSRFFSTCRIDPYDPWNDCIFTYMYTTKINEMLLYSNIYIYTPYMDPMVYKVIPMSCMVRRCFGERIHVGMSQFCQIPYYVLYVYVYNYVYMYTFVFWAMYGDFNSFQTAFI